MTSKVKPEVRPKLTTLPDPPEEERDMQQFEHSAYAAVTLYAYFAHIQGRSDVLVSGEGYLCRRAGEARRSPRPDLVVALNLPFNPDYIVEANGYTIEEVGQPPDFVLEVGSETTGRRDYGVKREIYAGLSVTEYWRFDPTGGRHHDVALAGDTLVEGEYQPIPVEIGDDGIHRGYSTVLGLELHWREGQLRFYDPATGELLPTGPEAWVQRNQAQAERDQAEAQRNRVQVERDQAEAQRNQAQATRNATRPRPGCRSWKRNCADCGANNDMAR